MVAPAPAGELLTLILRDECRAHVIVFAAREINHLLKLQIIVRPIYCEDGLPVQLKHWKIDSHMNLRFAIYD